ncbi:hypothetical protein G4B88_029812 [Cannabis sativa]|uniref:Uncharacterized protein n=1 Tax=Cannabis sativa TaxID=3483 RepID=A0A7J6EBL7_CANSA|nr:hypothetical protein G4B88_024995 [Cannabis sativa]KAF4381457.1 hypothetical protein G4B88_029812 [Cannabis sativa]
MLVGYCEVSRMFTFFAEGKQGCSKIPEWTSNVVYYKKNEYVRSMRKIINLVVKATCCVNGRLMQCFARACVQHHLKVWSCLAKKSLQWKLHSLSN